MNAFRARAREANATAGIGAAVAALTGASGDASSPAGRRPTRARYWTYTGRPPRGGGA